MTLFHRVVQHRMASPHDASGSSPSSSATMLERQHRQQQSSCRLLATSSSTQRTQQQILAVKGIDGHTLCQYQKGFFAHLKPKPFVMSTIRVGVQQGMTILSSFMTDQMESDNKRNELVDLGKLSQAEADEQSEEWEKREWSKRWQVYPERFITAFAKYHVITLVMRSYELVAEQFCDKLTMDKLTMDTFSKAKQITASSASASPVTTKGGNSTTNKEIANEMFHTSLWANLIAFLSDYTVHQAILCYVYVQYIRRQRAKNRTREEPTDNEEDVVDGALLASFLKKSTLLSLSRGVGLICSAGGGAIGTLVRPGWGTLLCASMGEAMAGVIVDDGQGGSPPSFSGSTGSSADKEKED